MQNKNDIYTQIVNAKAHKKKLLAILLDPDKIVWEQLELLIETINESPATHIFIGGSLVKTNRIDELILRLKKNIKLPIVLFPGNPSQISKEADGILFLSLLSGRNPDFLIEHQVKAAPILKQTELEIIPTAYLLIESGTITAVEKVSQTQPIERNNLNLVLATAQAAEMMGNKLLYLEAGSGAQKAVPTEMVEVISKSLNIPVIVGGGIIAFEQIKNIYKSGADLVVIGTAFEKDLNFFKSKIKNH